MKSKINLWLAIALGLIVAAVLYNLFGGMSSSFTRILTYSDLLKEVGAGRVSDVYIDGNELTAHGSDGQQFTTTLPAQQQSTIDALVQHGVRITIAPDAQNPLIYWILSWLPFVLFMGILVYYMRGSRRPWPSPSRDCTRSIS